LRLKPRPNTIFFSPGPGCEALACDWTATSFEALKRFIEKNVTRMVLQQDALDRIKNLDPTMKDVDPTIRQPTDAEQSRVKVWNDLASFAPSTAGYEKGLLDRLVKMACDGSTALHAIRGFARDFEFRFSERSDQVTMFANKLLSADCFGARGLSERDRDRLAKLRDLPQPASKSPTPTEQTTKGGELAVALRTELTELADQHLASNVGSPSVAVNGQVVFYTGNWYAAVSQDGGKTFKYIDPFTALPATKLGFCCGQVVNYIPAIDTFVWLLNYQGINVPGDNIQRLAYAKTADVVAGKWRVFDISGQTLGMPGTYVDYGDLAVGANNLYVTTNVFTAASQLAGSAVVRIPFTEIASGQITEQHFVSKDLNSLRVAQNCGTTAFFAAHQDSSTLAVFSWDEAKPQPVKSLVGVARWVGRSGYDSKGPDGLAWLGRADPRITGATMAGSELWLAWSVDKDSQKPQPFVKIAKIDVRDILHMSVIANEDIFDLDSAIAYPALSTNADNEVGISYMIGGGRRFPSHVVAMVTGTQGKFVTFGDRGPSPNPVTGGGELGDYLTVRPVFPDRRLFAAAGYTLKGKGDGSNRDATPQLVIFGRPESAKITTVVPASEMRPGVFRWSVKTGTDPDAALVGPTSRPTQTTVEELIRLPRPADMPATESIPVYQNKRARPVEITVYSVEATIIALNVEASGDYHLVLQGASGETMIARAPNPGDEFVAPDSRWKKEITQVRRQLDAKYFPATGKIARVTARAVGVGFFDRIHGQTGGASNGLELHPVLGIEFIESRK
jgi:hypothetical protein